ncbi:DUF1754-domain-containing protein [Dendrothele bispora CBS 962.96]|uniref:DUF1754-domain-containing protein n=1 Tax=Dendrothele bispora (strain CBS 962.96) TaxID=1314807 RepID=A0A4S8MWP1_DENBC|nr:DUF1754-domain-containing protein [Dendrothele bispora CBS 962.96]
MSDYDIRPAGSLKLKGSSADGGTIKKKKKKSSTSKTKEDVERARERERVKQLLLKDDVDQSSPSGSGRNSPAAGGSNSRKTDAEKRFDEVQKRRLAQKVAKLATKTHKDRVNEFNSNLELLSEHHDIPKVGPG